MQPSEALSTSAQIAVTLAGFAGVVVAFRSGSVHERSNVDKFRLRILLINSSIPLGLSIFAMLLSTTALEQERIWQVCSVLAFVLTVVVGQFMTHSLRSLFREEFRRRRR
jgi:drug/metabolite transporter (DMT)-like permease